MENAGYHTKQRQLILTCIRACGGHITAQEIAKKLGENGTPVAIATVYRQLDKLVQGNVIRKFTPIEGESACYQLTEESGGCTEHFHLKCTDCGRLIHMDCDFMCDMDDHIKQHHGFTVDSAKTVLYGCCEKCHKNKERDGTI